MKRWSVSPQGKLHMVADLSGAMLKVAFPWAWAMVMPAIDRPGFASWIVVAVLYLVHRIALSGATHGDGAKRKIVQIDVTMDSENATKIDELVETAPASSAVDAVTSHHSDRR